MSDRAVSSPGHHSSDHAVTKPTRAPSPALDRLKEEIEKAPHDEYCGAPFGPVSNTICTCFKSRALRIIEELYEN